VPSFPGLAWPALPALPCPALSNGVAAVAAVAERDGKAGGVMWRAGVPSHHRVVVVVGGGGEARQW
jgi:hypothetical protein